MIMLYHIANVLIAAYTQRDSVCQLF